MHKFMHKHRRVFCWLLMEEQVWLWLCAIAAVGLGILLVADLLGVPVERELVQGFLVSMGALGMSLLMWRHIERYIHEFRYHAVGGRYFEYRRRYGGQWWRNDPWLELRKSNFRIHHSGPSFYPIE